MDAYFGVAARFELMAQYVAGSAKAASRDVVMVRAYVYYIYTSIFA